MNLDALKDKLGDETFAELKKYVEDLTGQRDAARQESVDGRKKLKAEVEQLRAVKAQLFEKLGIDDDADIDTLPEIKGQAEAVKQVEAKLKRLEREKAEALTRADEVDAKWRSSRLDAALSKALAEHEFIDRDLVGSFVANGVQFEDDQIMYKAGEKLVPLEEGVKLLAQTKPSWLKATGARGSGHTPGAGSAGGARTLSRAEFEALTPAAKVEAAKAGVQIK